MPDFAAVNVPRELENARVFGTSIGMASIAEIRILTLLITN
jgi:hypothetical protein